MSEAPEIEGDEAIVKKIQGGQHELFGEVLQRYEAKITRYISKFLRDPKDSEDIAQEVFIKAYRNIQSFDPERKFSSWLYRIAHNESINFLKKRRVESIPLFDFDALFPHLSHQDHKEEINALELKELLDSSLSQLDPKYREPLLLYYIEGFDYKEIGEILRIPTATVGVRLNRGKKILREEYDKLNGGGRNREIEK